MKVLYVPLDERACNLRFPQLLAEMTGDVELIVPPAPLLGKLKRPADVAALWAWVLGCAPGCDRAILSIDTLLYGNIVNSRLHHLTAEECDTLLDNFRALKRQVPSLIIHGYNLVARVAGYNSASEDPDYWAVYGKVIWRYAYLTDKTGRGLQSDADQAELEELRGSIPQEYLNDFLARRAVCRHVNLAVLDLVKENVFVDLVIPKDDTAEFGYAAMDQRAVAHKVAALKLMRRVMVYPGADEVGSVLFARVFCAHTGFMPRVLVRYSSLLGAGAVPLYEDRPLHESIRAQVASAGGVTVEDTRESDLLLAVHAPGVRMIEAMDQDGKDVAYYSHHAMHDFFRFIHYYRGFNEKACALADVCFANGADKEMMAHALSDGILDDIDAYGGWNTAMNTVGVALAHGIISAYMNLHGASDSRRRLSRTFLLRKIVEDWLFQADLLSQIAARPQDFYDRPADPYALGMDEEPIRVLTQAKIYSKIREVFPDGFRGEDIQFDRLRFTWGRLFDLDFELSLGPFKKQT